MPRQRRPRAGSTAGYQPTEADKQMFEDILEEMMRAEANSRFYRDSKRRRTRAGPVALFNAILGVVLSIFEGIFVQLFPKEGDRPKAQRSSRGGNCEGEGGGGERAGAGDGNEESGDGHGEGDVPSDAPKMSQDPFETLGISEAGSTAADVTKAYRKLAIKWHPDKNQQSAQSVAMMQMINAARTKCLSALQGDGDGDGDGDGAGAGGDSSDDGEGAGEEVGRGPWCVTHVRWIWGQ